MKTLTIILTLLGSTKAFAECNYQGWKDPQHMHPCTYEDRVPDAFESPFHTDIYNTPDGQTVCHSMRFGNMTTTNCD